MNKLRWLLAIAVAVAVAPVAVTAQQAATITGRVTDQAGNAVGAATVSIKTINVGTQTGADGTYSLVVPAARLGAATAIGGTIPLTATRLGFASQTVNVRLQPGAAVTQNFQLGTDVLQLEGIVATGQGTQTTRERVTTAISTVTSQSIQQSKEVNVVSALAGKAPNVRVTASSGDPGAGTYIRIRDAASVVGGTQPLFVVDGTPIDNSSNATIGTTGGTAVTNRAADLNPNDVAEVQVLKGAAATAIYGSRGANGVVLITTKSGQAGATRATFSSEVGYNQVTNTVPLQQQYGRGLTAQVDDPNDLTNLSPSFTGSWGPPLADTVTTYDHADELYKNALRLDNNLTLSGGNDRTTYYLGIGRTDNNGVIRGNSDYTRNSVRLKGSQFFGSNIQITGNVAYAQTSADYIQQGSNTTGIQLGALRTPPEFNNLPYINPETGLQRSYRRPNPTSPNQSSGYDNPFFTANVGRNTSEVGRTFGNVAIDYAPVNWLKLNYTLGADYSSDDRVNLLPKSSATAPTGQLIRANFINNLIDSNLTATLSGTLRGNTVGNLTFGQNLNQEEFRQNLINTQNLLVNTAETDFSVDRTPNEYKYKTRTDGYFATGDLTFNDQFTLTATGRYDGSSTFGGSGQRFFYPSVGASWVFSKLPVFDNVGWLDFAKLRGSWGQAGRQPPVFSNATGYVVGTLTDGYISGINSIYANRQGIFRQGTQGNDRIKPEVKQEFEVGFDLALLRQRASLGVTYYNNTTSDVILDVPVPPSTGYNTQFKNAAKFTGSGWEMTLDGIPVQGQKFAWNINAQYARTRTCVKDLAGAEDTFLNGFTGSTVSLVSPEVTGSCQPFGVFFGDDFVRFGRGTSQPQYDASGTPVVDAQGNPVMVNIDEAYAGQPKGALYIGPDGFPRTDDQQRVVGDPNPDWTGSLRNTFTFFDNLRITGLLDIKQGGQVWNGTKGALYYFGTHAATLPMHGAGQTVTFGESYFPGYGENDYFPKAVGGPGVGQQVVLNWDTWGPGGIGTGFTGPMSQFIEDGGFVKLRDVSLSYTVNQPFIKRIGFNAIDLTVSGRNLYTWTNYTGIDPESNLTAQSTGRGLDYFNNPQSRSFIFTVNLNR